MKIAIMQPYFFPYLGYFQLINSVDLFTIYNHLKYTKRSWINRNRLLMPSGDVYYFTLPISSKSDLLIKDICVTNLTPWRKKFFKSLNYNYSKSKYYYPTMDMVERVLNSPETYLSNLNVKIIREIAAYLDIKTTIHSSGNEVLSLERDLLGEGFEKLKLENNISNFCDTKTARIVLLARKSNACHYINLIGGNKIYDKAVFNSHGIKIDFLKMKPKEYPQRSHTFSPSLSILDVLMNCGVDETRAMLDGFDLL